MLVKLFVLICVSLILLRDTMSAFSGRIEQRPASAWSGQSVPDDKKQKWKRNMLSDNFKTSWAILMNMEPGIASERKELALKILSDGPGKVYCGEGESLVVSRREAAKIFGFSPGRVDQLTSSGKLKRFCIPGCKKSTGILRSSIDELLAAGAR